MSAIDALGFLRPSLPPRVGHHTEHRLVRHPLRRVLAFTRRSIDDVVNDPIARNEVIGYYKLYRHIERQSQVLDLEQQWNSIGL